MAWDKMDPAASLLLTQAGRIADRLEVLDRMHSGDPGVWLAVKIAGEVAEVRVTATIREEAQQSEVLRKLIMDIQRMRPAGSGDDGAKSENAVARIVAEIYGKRG
ncbi:terminase small subunit [Mycobacterium phage Rem711]|uniref:Terminase small subunit n=1 Tax=Mycobacterium phage Rem711 TaxID=2079285 RepID=A0A2K9VEY0_9CAUD|nr:terminase small subunit [Mycobacterium phage Rem711]AUV60779.1 terminase small subunit [Mycobacterium phage Rem711]